MQPPGLPESSNDQDNHFFAAHVNKTLDQATRRRATTPPAGADGSIQGWLCRNGTLAVKDGALLITPDAKAAAKSRRFVTSSDIDLVGPVTATLKVRAKSGGASTIT